MYHHKGHEGFKTSSSIFFVLFVIFVVNIIFVVLIYHHEGHEVHEGVKAFFSIVIFLSSFVFFVSSWFISLLCKCISHYRTGIIIRQSIYYDARHRRHEPQCMDQGRLP
jgi:hypothetical protein